MKILYMGTAAAEGWPALFCDCPVCRDARQKGGRNLRTRTQSLLGEELLIDFPPDSYVHAASYGINYAQIHHLLVTHSHMDHWFPTDLVHRNELFAHEAEGTLEIYGNEACKQAFDQQLSIDRFKPHPIDDVVHFHTVHGGDTFQAGAWTITAVPADHDRREECLVYICRKDGKTLFYGHDTGLNLTMEAWTLLGRERFDLISLDATMGVKSIGGYHMGLADIEGFIAKLTELHAVDEHTVKVINHFSHNGELTHEQLAAWGEERGILTTWDGREVAF